MSDNSSESRGLRGTVVVIQHATYPLAAANRSLAIRSPERLNQLVADALMIPLDMVVGDELGDCASKMSLPQRDHARKALLLDRPNEPLRVRVAVRCPERRLNDPNALLFEEFQHGTTPLPIAVAYQHATVGQDTVNRIRQAAYGLHQEGLIGRRSGVRHVDTPRVQLDDEECVVRH